MLDVIQALKTNLGCILVSLAMNPDTSLTSKDCLVATVARFVFFTLMKDSVELSTIAFGKRQTHLNFYTWIGLRIS